MIRTIDKINLNYIYLNIQFLRCSKHTVSVNHQLVLWREIIAVCPKNYTKYEYEHKLCRLNVELYNAKPGST
jgi:hypothetical protein